jgi:hypothetical protein
VLKHSITVSAVHVLAQPDAIGGPAQQACQRGSACLPRLAPQILAVELEQVEGVEENLARILAGRRSPPSGPQTTPSPSRVMVCTLSASSASATAGTRSV